MRPGFILAEVRHGLRRNLTMTLAVIITVGVSLSLFGSALLVRAQVSQMKDYWYDRVEVSIFLCGAVSEAPSCSDGSVTDSQKQQILADLDALKPLVEKVYYESQDEALKRFREQFKDSPLAENATADQMPESYRVKLQDPTKFAVIASAFTGRPGVEDVRDQRQALDRLFKALAGLQALGLAIAAAMLFVTVLLIANTMRVARSLLAINAALGSNSATACDASPAVSANSATNKRTALRALNSIPFKLCKRVRC